MTTPEKEKKLRLMLRQVADTQVQAGKILAGDNQPETIRTFAQSCNELNRYIRMHEEREEVIEVLDEIPEISYERIQRNFWTMVVNPGWLNTARKSAVLEQIREAHRKYHTLELRLRGITVDSLK